MLGIKVLTRGPFRCPRPSGGLHRKGIRVICGPHPDPPPPSEQSAGDSESPPGHSRTESGEFKFRVEAANAAASRVGPGRPQGTNPRGLSILLARLCPLLCLKALFKF